MYFRQDRNAPFAFQVIGVHHALRHLFVGAENVALFQHCIDQCGFAVVNMGDNGNVADVISNHFFAPSFKQINCDARRSHAFSDYNIIVSLHYNVKLRFPWAAPGRELSSAKSSME